MSAPWKLALLGDPVAHSRSPDMQNAALAAAGLEGGYELIRCPAGELAERLPRLAEEGFRGLNLTVPLKEEGFALLEDLSPEARRLRAVNTLRWTGETWQGHNSDLEGFTRAARDHFGALEGKSALILGAGGAARAVLAALIDMGLARVCILNRDEGRARDLAGAFDVAGTEIAMVKEPGQVDAVIQATSLGLHEADALPPLSAEGCPAVMDLVTHETPWLRACRERGCKAADGRAMLLGQGAAAFTYWTGMAAPLQAMDRALESP